MSALRSRVPEPTSLTMRHLVALVFLAGCTLAVPAAVGSGAPSELAGRVAGQPSSCISLPQGERLVPLDESTLAYHSGKTLWVTHTTTPCRGLDDLSTLIFEQSGSQICRGDR